MLIKRLVAEIRQTSNPVTDQLIIPVAELVGAEIILSKGTKFTAKAVSNDSLFFGCESLTLPIGQGFVRIFLPKGSLNPSLIHTNRLQHPPVHESDGKSIGNVQRGSVLKRCEVDNLVLSKGYTHGITKREDLLAWYIAALTH